MDHVISVGTEEPTCYQLERGSVSSFREHTRKIWMLRHPILAKWSSLHAHAYIYKFIYIYTHIKID